MTRAGRPTTLPEPWRTYASWCQGVDRLAQQLGISTSQVYRIAHKQRTPSKSVVLLLKGLVNTHGDQYDRLVFESNFGG